MRPALRLLASTAVLAVLASAASAADYDPPIFIQQAPEYVPVEVGSGWYLRGDVTYIADEPLYRFEYLGSSPSNRRFGGSGGIGYNLTDLLRTDLNMGYVAGDKISIESDLVTGSAKYHAWYGMLNTYLDLGTVAGFTPYIGAGAGVLHSRHSVDSDLFSYSRNEFDFAYTLNAGLAYRVADNLSLDVGYQYLEAPKAEYFNMDTLLFKEGIEYHQVKVGLRYDLW